MSGGPLRPASQVFASIMPWILLVTAVALGHRVLTLGLDAAAVATSLFWLVVLACAGLVRRRQVLLAQRLFSGAIVALALVLLPMTGGTTGPVVPYLGIVALQLWLWAGRSVAFAFVAAASVEMVLARGGVPVGTDELVIGYVVATVLAVCLLQYAMVQLRVALTRSVEQAEDAEAALSRAEEAAESRDRFLDVLSLELRAPLDVVIGYSELMAEEEVDPDRRQDVRQITTAARHLASLVEDLLDMSKVHADELEVECEAVELVPLLRDVAQIVAPVAGQQGLAFSCEVEPSLPNVWADRRRLRQVLTNLLTNAVKYTNEGSVRVTARRSDRGVDVAVRDTGIGIAEAKLDSVFEAFVQLQEGSARRSGVGLGLALSRSLAERMGARIEVESEVGVGSTFTLALRLVGPSLCRTGDADRQPGPPRRQGGDCGGVEPSG